MNYDRYIYLWPPRPEERIPQGLLTAYENKNWVAQIKKNGTNTPIFTNGSQVIFKTRHNDDHKMWSPTPAHLEEIKSLASNGKWHVFCAELLHNKTTHIKNQLYIFDVLVMDGVQLVGETFADRHSRLLQIVVQRANALHVEAADLLENEDQYRISPHVSVARCFANRFAKLFTSLKPEDEGLVLKNPQAKLGPCFKEGSNATWSVKSRIPHKNYGF